MRTGKMKYILALMFLLPMTISAQIEQKRSEPVQKGFGVSVVQVQPEFPGGADSLQSFLKANLVYPDSAKYKRIQGRVYIGFLVDRKGRIKDAKLLSGVNKWLDDEALRVVNIMPQWTPGTAGGSAVDVQYILPIDFIVPRDIRE
jgi:TonB family protein